MLHIVLQQVGIECFGFPVFGFQPVFEYGLLAERCFGFPVFGFQPVFEYGFLAGSFASGCARLG